MIPSLAFSQTNDRLIFVGKTGFRFEKTDWSIAENLEGGQSEYQIRVEVD